MKKLRCIFFAFFFLLVLAPCVMADEFVVMTGVYPPFSINKGLKIEGISIDTFEMIMKMTDTPFNRKNVKLMPWKKAYAAVLQRPKHVMLNVPRVPKLEEYFKWVGPVYFPSFVLVGRKGEEYAISSVSDASNYSIGSIMDSDPSATLIEQGVDANALKMNSSYVQPFLQLKNKQIDLIAHSNLATTFLMRQMRMDQKKYTVVFTYKKIPLYFAFSKATDDAYIKKLNDALASYKIAMANGDSAFNKNVRKYLPDGIIE